MKQEIVPDHYWVLVIPGFFPWGLEFFRKLQDAIQLKTSQIIDGSYNKNLFYQNDTFCLNTYSEYVEHAIKKARKRFDKIIAIWVSFWWGIGSYLNKQKLLDGNLLLSPVFTDEGIERKYFHIFKKFWEGNINQKGFERYLKIAKLEWYSYEDMQNGKEFLLQRMNFMNNEREKKHENSKIHFSTPTLVYYAEKECNLLVWEKEIDEMNTFEKFFCMLIDMFDKKELKEKRKKHASIHIDKNPNYQPIKNATGNFQVVTNMSHPDIYLEHGQFQRNLNPYIYALKYLVCAIDNNISLAKDDRFKPEKVAWPHMFWILREKLNTKGIQDQRLLYMVESLIRIDKKEEISYSDLFHAFIKTWIPSLYYWWKNNSDTNWHPKDMRNTV